MCSVSSSLWSLDEAVCGVSPASSHNDAVCRVSPALSLDDAVCNVLIALLSQDDTVCRVSPARSQNDAVVIWSFSLYAVNTTCWCGTNVYILSIIF